MEARTAAIRKHGFMNGDDGLASIVEMESAGRYTGSHAPLVSRTVIPRNIARLPPSGIPVATVVYGFSSPRSGRVHDSRFEEVVSNPPHFLDSCFVCKKRLSNNDDIFMYRGDIPFCSEECRLEQIERDDAKEKKWNLSASIKAMRRKKMDSSFQKSSTTSYRGGTVAAA